MGVITKRETFPSIQIGQTKINYKTGITSTSRDLAFDFYSGQVTKTLSTDGYGNHYISETTPAYKKYAGMGLAINDGVNMLTQVASNSTVKLARQNRAIAIDLHFTESWSIFDNFGDFSVGEILYMSIDGIAYSAIVDRYLNNGYKTISFLEKSPTTPTVSGIYRSGIQGFLSENQGLVTGSVQTWSNETLIQGVSGKYGGYSKLGIYSSKEDNIARIVDLEDKFTLGDKFSFNHSIPYTGIIIEEIAGSNPKEFSALIEPNFSSTITNYLELSVRKDGIYRKQAAYSWLGNDQNLLSDGLYPYSHFREFTAWDAANGDPQWQKNGEITLYDTYSHALEAADVNGKYAATKMDSKQEVVLATVANASYDEFCYSGAEDDLERGSFGGGVTFSGIAAIPVLESDGHPVHTGLKSMYVFGNTGGGFTYTISADEVEDRHYVVSAWVHKDNKDHAELQVLDDVNTVINSLSGTEVGVERTAGDWVLLQLTTDLSSTAGDITFLCKSTNNLVSIYMDDFRVHPLDAAMTSYVYNEWGELSHILDANNIYTEYRYDGMGRLTETHRETFDHGVVKTSETSIHYANQD
jgi:YD repeat-containing protein